MERRARQLGFDLRQVSRWGGRREGAGRTRGPSSRDPHCRRAPLAARFPCHVTLKVRRDVPSLRSVRLVRELECSFAAACERGRFRLVHYSVQADHAHLVVEAASSRDLASGMKSIAARLARAVNRVFLRHGPVLADRYHLHVLGWRSGRTGDPGPGPVAKPHTWLLSVGWRRHGLIDPTEIPGIARGRKTA